MCDLEFLVIGRPGVDGIQFGYRAGTLGLWGYSPIDEKFKLLAPTVNERLVKMELAVPINRMRLPQPGRYEISILFDGRELATQFIDIEAENDDETR